MRRKCINIPKESMCFQLGNHYHRAVYFLFYLIRCGREFCSVLLVKEMCENLMREIHISHRDIRKYRNGSVRRKGIALILTTLKSATSKHVVQV
jgi:hypothetical protein